jgi:Tol biopolymer transport system component
MHCRVMVRAAITVVASLIATSAAAQIIVPTLVSTQNDNTDVAAGASLDNLTNGSGLSSPLPNGSTLETALTVTHTFSASGELQSWTTRSSLPSTDYYSASPMPVFVWDLGQDTPLDHIVLWQYGNDGGGLNRDGNAARTFLLRFNTAAEGTSFAGASEFGGTLTRPWATGGTNGAQAFPLGGVIARYVELTVSDNYFGAGTVGGGDRVGLGEIRFNAGTVSNAVPVTRSIVVSAQEGMAGAGALLATDADGDALVFSIVTPPAKGTLTITDTATGAFIYIPNAGAVGYDTFRFRATDGSGASSEAMGAVFIVASSPRWPGQTVRVSIASDGTEGNGSSIFGGISSADGRFIAFNSAASNLVAGDTNGEIDVFVHDRQTGLTTRVSVASNASEGNGLSLASDLTPDGRYVAFTSSASNLVADDTNGQIDAFVHDRQTGQTTRISVASDGTQGNDESVHPVLSADGRYVAFYGSASNLVAGDTNSSEDVFVHDRQTGHTTLVSVSSVGVQGNSNNWRPSMSADGRFIAFQSESSNLVAGDTNGAIDLFVHDLWAGQTTRVSVASDGAQANGGSGGFLSVDGRYVALTSVASNLVPGDTNGVEDAFVHDRQTGLTTRVSVPSSGAQANDVTTFAKVSGDGRYVVIQSMASNLVENDTNGAADVFVHDRQTGRTVRVSVSNDGSQGNAASAGSDDFGSGPLISADGRSILLPSSASNLVASDANNTDDMFVVGPVSVSPTTLNVPAAGGVGSVSVSFDYPGTPWSATAEDAWVTITNQSSTNRNGSVDFFVAPNSTGVTRTGALTVATQTVTIVQERSTAPAATDGSIATVEDTATSGTLSATDPKGAPLTYSIVTNGTLGTATVTNAATGAFTYTPSANANGTDTFTFKVNNGSADSNIATVTATITAVNDAPVALDSEYPAIEDTPLSVSFQAIDVDSATLTFSIIANGLKGTAMLTNAATGAFAYTPNPNANGTDVVTFRAFDGALFSNAGTLTIQIAPVNDAPVAQTGVVTTSAGVQGAGALLASDVDGDPLTFSLTSDPTLGTVVLTDASAGTFTYTPNPGATGYDTFTFTVSDAQSTATGLQMVFIVAGTLNLPGQTTRVSVASDDTQGDRESSQPGLSADGRYTAFYSWATNLVDGDNNGTADVFVRDRQTGETRRVSVASDGTEGNGVSYQPSLSADGRYVAFRSEASNLVAGDTNQTWDVFVHDRQTGETQRVSVASDGTQGNGISYQPSLSADGRYVAFHSDASNLVAGDTNGTADVFVHDRHTGETRRVSVASDTTPGNDYSYEPSLSADGRHVVFSSFATNLVAGDTNARVDVFVHDRQTGETRRVSVASGGGQGNGDSYQPSLSADGRYVAFISVASNLVGGDTNATYDVFVRDLQTGGTTRVSVASDGTQANNQSLQSALSADGRYVAFRSVASNLVAGDTNGTYDVFVHDRQTRDTRRVSVASNGTQGNNHSVDPWLSADGRYAAFTSYASNLVAGDTNGSVDVFVVGAAPPPSDPVADDGTLTTLEDIPGTGTLLATDPNGDSLTFSIVSNGTLGTATVTNATTGAFTYTPNPNANGADSFTFKANDGPADSNVATVLVTIAPVNDLPVASDGTLAVAAGASATGTLSATDIDSASLTYAVITNGSKGSAVVTDPATGAYTYTAKAGASGTDTFTFRANDGSLDSNTATVTVTINAVNHPPVAQTSVGTTIPGVPFSGMLLASDPDGDAVVFTLLSQPSQGSVVLTDATTGAFTYTPSAGASGYDSFTYQVESAGGAGALAAASLDTSSTGTFMLFIVASSPQWPGQTTRVSVASDGAQADGSGSSFVAPSVSADGRLVAFVSNASNLVVGDSNGASDVFVHDRQTGLTTRVSVASDGTQANNGSGAPSISADERFVAFSSFASNLVPGDSNGTTDVFVHDRLTGATTRVSVTSDGTQANGFSDTSSVSADGRFVAFRSAASNLVTGDTNATQDVFVHDRQTGETTRVSVASDGTQATPSNGSVQPSLSADGRFVGFASSASNLVAGDTFTGHYDVFVHDRQTRTTTRVSVASDGTPDNNNSSQWPSISADGRFVAFSSRVSTLVADDTNNQPDAFVHDRQTGTTTRVSVASDGTQSNGDSSFVSVSADGRFVAFQSSASNLAVGDTNAASDVFVVGAMTAPVAAISPGALAFGNQLVGTTSASQTVTLSNTGNGDLVITDIAMTGTNAGDFARTTTCGATLAPGATCTIAVAFTPSGTGLRTARLQVATNAASPTTVGLTGTGTAPAATLSNDSLTFGNQNVGTTSAAQAVTLSNSGTGPLLISTLSVTGVNGADFGETNTCGASVAPGASCTISVTFAPTNTGTRAAVVSIVDNAPGSPHVIGLTGTGRPGQITLTPSALTFVPQPVGTTSAGQAVTVKNAGTTTMTLSGSTASGDFSVSGTTCGSSLAPGATCTVNVVFTPTSAGSRAGTLTVTSNVGPGTVALTGTGTILTLSPSAIDFGNQTVGTSSVRAIALRNISSTTAVDISSMALGGNASADFATTTTCGSTIAPGAICTIDVRFTPTKKGARNASLTVTHTSFGSPLTVSLRGTGK